MHSKRQAQIRALLLDKAFTEIWAEYFDYSNAFLSENIAEFPKNNGINKYAIELKENKQRLFEFIYSLGLVELEILKTYIKTNQIVY